MSYVRVKWGVWLLTLLALALAAGCRETRYLPAPEPQLPDAAQAYNANVQRMPLATSTRVATLSGLISVSGLTILNNSSGTPALPGTALSQIMARLLDPEDDILRTVYPSTSGAYRIDYNQTLSKGKLRLTFRVAQDLNGDGSGGDTVDQYYPVSLVLGRVAKLNITLSPATATVLGALTPTAGEVLLTSLDQLDGAGANRTQFGSFVADGQVIYDQDRDGTLELGDDYSAPDTDQNGWADQSEGGYSLGGAPGDPGLLYETLSGLITAVDLAAHSLSVRSDLDGATVTVLYDPLVCRIEPYVPISGFPPLRGDEGGADGELPAPAYDYLAPIPFDASLAGRQVIVSGFTTEAGFSAVQIVVLEPN